MLKKFKLLIILILSCSLLCSCSNETQEPDVSTTGNLTTLSVLFHQPYFDITGISPHHEADRKQILAKIESCLLENSSIVKLKDGGLFSKDYYALTDGGSNGKLYRYYGSIKNNRPNGFGVLASGSVDFSDCFTLSRLIYAGNFKNGRFDGYGASFNALTDTGTKTENSVAQSVDALIESKKLTKEHESLAIAYLMAYVTYDGEWKNGVENGKGNAFKLSISGDNAPSGYWCDGCYPRLISITEVKNAQAHGYTKIYNEGILSYEGEMRYGAEHGNGIRYYSNGNVRYDGQWKNGKYDGKGKLFDEDGTLLYDGKWKNGDYAS